MVVIAIHFSLQHHTSIFEGRDSFQGTSAHDAVLQPAKGALDFAFSLGRKGISDADFEQAHDLSPLWVDVIGFQNMIAPKAIPLLDKTKDSQVIHVIANRQAIFDQDSLCSLNMSPRGLMGKEIGE